jgi:hypothetical protein
MKEQRHNYYRVLDDPLGGRRWYLGLPVDEHGEDLDWTALFHGERPSFAGTLVAPIKKAGTPVAFTLAGFDVPVVQEDVFLLLQEHVGEDVFGLPVRVKSAAETFFILGTRRVLACLDEERSEIVRWKEGDGRPDKVGGYRMVTEMHIDPTRADGAGVFRIRGWEVALIVSGEIKDALLGYGSSGVSFGPV